MKKKIVKKGVFRTGWGTVQVERINPTHYPVKCRACPTKAAFRVTTREETGWDQQEKALPPYRTDLDLCALCAWAFSSPHYSKPVEQD